MTDKWNVASIDDPQLQDSFITAALIESQKRLDKRLKLIAAPRFTAHQTYRFDKFISENSAPLQDIDLLALRAPMKAGKTDRTYARVICTDGCLSCSIR